MSETGPAEIEQSSWEAAYRPASQLREDQPIGIEHGV